MVFKLYIYKVITVKKKKKNKKERLPVVAKVLSNDKKQSCIPRPNMDHGLSERISESIRKV